MIGYVKSYGELDLISMDYSSYSVALFRIKITTSARVDINDSGVASSGMLLTQKGQALV